MIRSEGTKPKVWLWNVTDVWRNASLNCETCGCKGNYRQREKKNKDVLEGNLNSQQQFWVFVLCLSTGQRPRDFVRLLKRILIEKHGCHRLASYSAKSNVNYHSGLNVSFLKKRLANTLFQNIWWIYKHLKNTWKNICRFFFFYFMCGFIICFIVKVVIYGIMPCWPLDLVSCKIDEYLWFGPCKA